MLGLLGIEWGKEWQQLLISNHNKPSSKLQGDWLYWLKFEVLKGTYYSAVSEREEYLTPIVRSMDVVLPSINHPDPYLQPLAQLIPFIATPSTQASIWQHSCMTKVSVRTFSRAHKQGCDRKGEFTAWLLLKIDDTWMTFEGMSRMVNQKWSLPSHWPRKALWFWTNPWNQSRWDWWHGARKLDYKICPTLHTLTYQSRSTWDCDKAVLACLIMGEATKEMLSLTNCWKIYLIPLPVFKYHFRGSDLRDCLRIPPFK